LRQWRSLQGATVLYELVAEVIPVGVSPNGMNINEERGSTHPEAMIRAVKEYRADIGIALDGDADRLVICDERGQVIDGDQIMVLIAGHWATRDRLNGGGIVDGLFQPGPGKVHDRPRPDP